MIDMTRNIDVSYPVNDNIKRVRQVNLDAPDVSSGDVVQAVSAYVTATEIGDPGGLVHQTLLTLTNLPLTVRNTEQGGGVKIYNFPAGYIARLGAVASVNITTTSTIASTLKTGVTCNYGVGSTTQASATLATTEQDFVNVTNITSSATINVAGATAGGVGPAVLAALDGHTTAIAAYFNLAVATGTDIDADATVLVNGTVRITWINVGDN